MQTMLLSVNFLSQNSFYLLHRKSHRNASRDIASDKVGVDFDLTFQSSEVEVIQTLRQVAKNGVISELLVFPDSVSIESK